MNRLDSTCERACTKNPIDKYYAELYRTITDCNGRNGAPFSNKEILDTINRVVVKEEADSHNFTVNTFSQTPVTPNIKGENENTILTADKLNNSDALSETLKGLTINDTAYDE